MSNHYTFQYDSDEMDNQANQVKEILLEALLQAGAINEENYKFFIENYAVVLKKRGFWGKLLEKKNPIPDTLTHDYIWTVVKLETYEK